MSEQERGWGVAGLELRSAAGGRPRLSGYAAVFDTRSLEIFPGFVEIIRPGAFARVLRAGVDIRAFVEHDPARIIGRRSAGTLALEEDAHGLKVDITPIDTHDGEDVVKNIRAGNLDGMSFAFQVPGEQGEAWDWDRRPPLRELLDLDVLEVSVVALPAYPATTVAIRSRVVGTAGRPRVADLEARLRAQAARW